MTPVDTPARTLELAQTLYELFEMRFSRDWDDLPEDCQQEWLDNARDLIQRMRPK
jgi:hypothetical protein